MARTQHPVEIHGLQTIIDDGLETHEMSVRDLLRKILSELKLLNRHIQLVTEEEIEQNDY